MRRPLALAALLALLAAAPARAQDSTAAERLDEEPGLRFIVGSATAVPGWTAVRVRGDSAVVWLGGEAMRVGAGELDSVGVGLDSLMGEGQLGLRLAPGAAARFAALTGAGVGSPVAVVVDGYVLLAPVLREAITGGEIQVSGLSWKEGERAALALRRLLAEGE